MTCRHRNTPQWFSVLAAVLVFLGGEATDESNPILRRLLRYSGGIGAAIALYTVDPRRRREGSDHAVRSR